MQLSVTDLLWEHEGPRQENGFELATDESKFNNTIRVINSAEATRRRG